MCNNYKCHHYKSFQIHHLSFGDPNEIKLIKKEFKKGLINPLDSSEQIKKSKMTYEYYITVVPTTYKTLKGQEIYVNQYSYHFSSFLSGNRYPSVYFKYELSPVTVEYTQYKDDFLNFFIQICAILGGVFTVTGIIDALIHKSVVTILKKAERGKLG